MWVWIGKKSITLDEQGAVGSLEILNSDGKGIGQIHELKCQAVTRSQLESVLSLKANISDWMYEWQWQRYLSVNTACLRTGLSPVT